MVKRMKSTNKIMLERLQKNPDNGKKNVDYLMQEFHRGQGKDMQELMEEAQHYKEEWERLRGHNPRGAGRKRKFTQEQVEMIRKDRSEGATISLLAGKYGCSVGLIHKLICEQRRV